MRTFISFKAVIEKEDDNELVLTVGSNPVMLFLISLGCGGLCVVVGLLLSGNPPWVLVLLEALFVYFILIVVAFALNYRLVIILQKQEKKLLTYKGLKGRRPKELKQVNFSDIETVMIEECSDTYVQRGIPATVEYWMLSIQLKADGGKIALVAGKSSFQLEPLKGIIDGVLHAVD